MNLQDCIFKVFWDLRVKFAILVFDEENKQICDSGPGDAVNPCCMLPIF